MNLSVSTIEKHIGKGKQICRSRLAACDSGRDGALDALLSGSRRSYRGRAAETDAYAIAAE